jgi:hypothetical protein
VESKKAALGETEREEWKKDIEIFPFQLFDISDFIFEGDDREVVLAKRKEGLGRRGSDVMGVEGVVNS